MPDPQQAVSQSDWDSAKTVSQSDWDSAKPVGSDEHPASATGRFLSNLWQHVSPSALLNTITSPTQAVTHPIATAQAIGQDNTDLYNKAKSAFDRGDYVEGAFTGLNYLLNGIPGLGSSIQKLQEQGRSGDIAGEAGGSLGVGLNIAATAKAPDIAVKAAEALPAIRSTIAARQSAQAPLRAGRFAADLPVAIPPSNATPYTSVDVARATPYLAAEHASSPVTTVPHVVEAADSAISQIEDHIAQYIGANPNRTITTNPVASAAAKMSQSVKGDFSSLGAKELAKYPDLFNPNGITLAQADRVRQQLNAENKVALSANQYDVANALKTDPAFAARQYVSQALRDGIYDALEQQGIPGVRTLRQDEGSLLAIRDAAQRQYFAGQRKVGGTGATGAIAQTARRVVPAASAALGAEVAGPAGAATADILGRTVTNAVLPGNLTRDALVEKAFARLGLQKPPTYPTIPPTQAPAGLLTAPATPQGSIPLGPSGPSAVPPVVGGTSQPSVFGNRLQLPAGTANGELTRTNLPPSPLRTQSQMQVLEARPILVRDPATGRFKRVYTAEPKGGGS